MRNTDSGGCPWQGRLDPLFPYAEGRFKRLGIGSSAEVTRVSWDGELLGLEADLKWTRLAACPGNALVSIGNASSNESATQGVGFWRVVAPED